MNNNKASKGVKIMAFFFILLIMFLSCRVLEYASFKILAAKGLLPPDGMSHEQLFQNKLSLWSGGLDNTAGYIYRGYNDSLLPGEITYSDQYGFMHGDSLPLQRKKPPNTIRIVLTGGSGMRGNLQTWAVVKMFGYPQGCYDYPTSIAGKLKSILSSKYPSISWEVINGAVVMHLFNQSFARYYEKIHDIQPDIIINMDGYNDDKIAYDFLGGGDPYGHTASQATESIELEILRRSSRWGYTCMLLSYCLTNTEFKPDNIISVTSMIRNTTARDAWHIARHMDEADSMAPLAPDSFRYMDPYLRRNMEKQFWLIASYENQLRHDSVYSIFCFQPILARQGGQKKLSRKETALRDYIHDDKPEMPFIYDSIFMKNIAGLPDDLVRAVNHTGPQKNNLIKYYHRYFINDYISPITDSIVRSYGGAYIDLGKAMMPLPGSVEVYMDYTHTTPYGNQFIAEQMAAAVIKSPILRKVLASDK
jgi:hypothetical protein